MANVLYIDRFFTFEEFGRVLAADSRDNFNYTFGS